MLSFIDRFARLQRYRTMRRLQAHPHPIPSDPILPHILVQNSYIPLTFKVLRKFLQFMVCVAPIFCPDLSSHLFCFLLGPWPHYAHPTTGVPATRGLADHPLQQRPHLPPPTYFSRPSYPSGSGPSTNNSRAPATERERLMRPTRDSIASDPVSCR